MNILEYESYHEQKSHFDASFPYNTYLCSIPFDFTNVPLHWHDEVEFIYIKVGTGIITVDFQKYIVQGGDIAIIWPGQIHSIEQLHDQAMEYENIIFQTSLLGESVIDRSYAQFIKPLLDGHFSTPAILTNQSAAYATVRHCLDKNDNIGMSFPDGYPLAIKGNLFSLFFAIYTAYATEPATITDRSGKDRNMEKIKSVIKYVEMHYADAMTIGDMAALVGFSESHFMKFFKQTMGIPFTTFLNNYRLAMAARLLLQSEETILNIASEVGYDNLSYFNRSFKGKYGMTPSAYRKT